MWKIQVQPIQLHVVCLQLVNTIYNLQNRQIIIIIDSQQKLMQNAVNHKSTINNNSKKTHTQLQPSLR